MNYINLIKSGFLAMTLACMATAFTGCKDDITIDTADSSKLNTVDGVFGYVKSAAGARELTPISIFGNNDGTGHLYFELSKAAEKDITVTFKVDATALQAYNKANNTSYEMYPANMLSIVNSTTTIKAGEKKSSTVDLDIKSGGSIGATYAVAVSATANDGVEMSANNQSYIYLVKPLQAIPDSRKGDVRTLCFVEVNDENILNCGEYFMTNTGKPFFDIVSIFAANINVDSETGRARVFCNDQVSFLLKNADKFIRPLQAKGIKVNLSILGNHDEAGMGSLSAAAAADFAKELKAYMDIYGLDGIDFDDEYTAYTDNPTPGFEKRSRENYCRLISECRKIMPNKLLGIYEYQLYDGPSGIVDGKSAGELVDYMCYGVYQSFANGREQSFTGLPKSKYGPYSLKINEEYNGGWTGFSATTLQKVKDAGYGLQVFYNPKPRTYSYDHYFTAVSNILYGDNVEWSGKYYTRTDAAPIEGVKSAYESYLGEWNVVSSNSLYVYVDESNTPRWWDWGGEQQFNVRIEKKEAGKSYYVYGWGSYPEISNKYPLVMNYDNYKGALSIVVPQTIHTSDATDPINWEMRWGTYGKINEWNFYDASVNPKPITGSISVNGKLGLYGSGARWGIDPCHAVNGKFVVPDINVKYHITDNYTLIKK